MELLLVFMPQVKNRLERCELYVSLYVFIYHATNISLAQFIDVHYALNTFTRCFHVCQDMCSWCSRPFTPPHFMVFTFVLLFLATLCATRLTFTITIAVRPFICMFYFWKHYNNVEHKARLLSFARHLHSSCVQVFDHAQTKRQMHTCLSTYGITSFSVSHGFR